MDSIREDGDRLVFERQPGGLPRLFWLLFAGTVVWIVVRVWSDARFVHDEGFVALLAGAGILAMSALFTGERSHFAFDRGRQLLIWHRRWLFSRKQGTVPFADIESVVTERPMGDEGVPSRRPVVCTRTGRLPMAMSYTPDHDEACIQLVIRIERFINLPNRAAPDRSE